MWGGEAALRMGSGRGLGGVLCALNPKEGGWCWVWDPAGNVHLLSPGANMGCFTFIKVMMILFNLIIFVSALVVVPFQSDLGPCSWDGDTV